MFIRNSLFL